MIQVQPKTRYIRRPAHIAANLRRSAEAILKDAAFVLQMTEKVKAAILEQPVAAAKG